MTMTRQTIDTLSRRSRERAICHGERPTIFLGPPGVSGGVSERDALSRRASASNFPAIKAIPQNLSFGLLDLPTHEKLQRVLAPLNSPPASDRMGTRWALCGPPSPNCDRNASAGLK